LSAATRTGGGWESQSYHPGVYISSRLARVRVWVSITSGWGGVGGGIRDGAVRRGGRGGGGCAHALPGGAGCGYFLPLLLRSARLYWWWKRLFPPWLLLLHREARGWEAFLRSSSPSLSALPSVR
jgi:hypothetical protein